jgi:hypothetical protein
VCEEAVMNAIDRTMAAAVDALAGVSRDLKAYRALRDDEVLALTRVAAEEVRLAQLHVSLLAGEIARRSAPELGHAGLAQRTGHRTPDELVRFTTGTRAADARTSVRVGSAAGAETPSRLGTAVLEGRVSVAVADAISTGLGAASGELSAEVLDDAAGRLIDRVGDLDADRVAREARALRDELDVEGIHDREAARRDQRSLRLGRRADGMGYAHWVLDPETFAIVSDVFDRVTSPKRIMPSFAGGDDSERAGGGPGDHRDVIQAARQDERTPGQRASDSFAELLRQGAVADTSQLLGDGPIGVRMIVATRVLEERRGRGWFEGQPEAVSVATVERQACSAGTVTLSVDSDGQPLNLGRERRLFSRAQRIALAARDGGCRWPGCERPPSWCEAHHIDHWHRDHGRTDVADGLLLCRHHHLLAHNNGWEISRAGPQYLLVPPGGGAADAVDMTSGSQALQDALSA